MNMTGLCPAATWTAIPELDRQSTPAILFAPGCLPGTADNSGSCKTKDLRYTIAIPWDTFLAQARKAPGGNLYWDASVPADRRNPTAFWLIEQMAIRNFVTWRARGKRGNEKVTDAINMGFLTNVGLVGIPIDPVPNETTDAFVKRGGQLFYPPTGNYYAFGGGVPLYSLVPRQLVHQNDPIKQLMFAAVPDWMEDVREVQIYANYVVAANRIDYTIRLAWTNAGARVVDSAVRWLEQSVSKLCTKLNDPTVMMATAAAASTPVTAPYAAGATAIGQLCSYTSSAGGCVPRPPGTPGTVEALLTEPVVLSTKYMRFASLPGTPAQGGGGKRPAHAAGFDLVPGGDRLAPAPSPRTIPTGIKIAGAVTLGLAIAGTIVLIRKRRQEKG